jgi:hypothetical protein
MVPQVSTTEKEDQIEVTGPAVKRVYDVQRTPEQINALRKELQKELKINLPEDKKVVVISTGAMGRILPIRSFWLRDMRGGVWRRSPLYALSFVVTMQST